ncbi:glycosyltransferase family 4 protein [Thermococcus sp.]|uniref:glycosyltransferase family 4 protein n=1 Tax=Thermococcus sp. TaxID=35749 RepID=UPI0026016E2B|nr:glycosyltransferase family 4 protein [Thermococcus sp.]
MKVLVHNINQGGGVTVVMEKVCSVLQELKKEFDFEVWCSIRGHQRISTFECCDKVMTYRYSSRLDRLFGYSYTFLKNVLLKKKIEKDFDLVFTHTPLWVNSNVIYIDGRDWDKFYKQHLNIFGKIIQYLPQRYVKMSVRNSTIFLLNSAAREFYVRNFPRSIYGNPNGIDWSNWINREKQFDFIYVGRFSYEKNPEIVFKAFLGTKYCGIMIGEDKNTLIRNIIVKKFMPRKMVFEYISQSKIGILPSRHEVFPITILEYLSFGLPVIVSDSIDSEIVEYCITFKCCDEADLYNTFEHVYENYEYYVKKYRKIRKIVLEKYDWDKILEGNIRKALLSYIVSQSHKDVPRRIQM